MKLRKEARIRVFNRWWWFYVALTVCVLILVTLTGRQLGLQARYRLVLTVSIIELVILRIYKFSLRKIRADYNYFNELPCYLCNQATLLCIVAAMTHSVSIMATVSR